MLFDCQLDYQDSFARLGFFTVPRTFRSASEFLLRLCRRRCAYVWHSTSSTLHEAERGTTTTRV
ncbi:protein of unknown function [Paraburkholderia dioscoreae]|uniref:Uncharacterized protein n=1 Tax=Paraburkholderia dioscoreae TaxID=2604047 RepID=A0A5Q4ZB45_9BURK|nr:protein of unknown function [Paraburkholderia dioscoreae]